MAEFFTREWFTKREMKNYKVMSRALTDRYEPPGSPASENGIIIMREDFGIDMSSHRSALLQQCDVDNAAAIICVSRGHAQFIASNFPSVDRSKLHALKRDVSDPWHADLSVYRACAHQLAELLPIELSELFST